MKFSWRIFLTTVIFGIGIVFPLEIAYASFISSSVNQNNSISSGYWIIPTVAPLPTATLTPVPTETPEPTVTFQPTMTETPVPTETVEPIVTDTPVPTETIEPTATETPELTVTETPVPTATVEPIATETPVPAETIEPTVTMTPEPTATTEPTATETPIPTETITPFPTGSQVVINEFMPKPTDGVDWVELYNQSSDTVDISSWEIEDSLALIRVIPTGTILQPNAFIYFTVGTKLNNASDDSVKLINSSAVQQDITSYSGADVETDKSFGRETDGIGTWKKCNTSTQNNTNDGSC